MDSPENILDDDPPHHEVRPSFPSFISIVDKKGSIDLHPDDFPDYSPLYTSPLRKSVASTSATPEGGKRTSFKLGGKGYVRRHALSSVVEATSGLFTPKRPQSPPRTADPLSTTRSIPTHRPKLSDRFLKLQSDLKRAGFDTDELIKSASDIDFSNYSDLDSLSKANSPRLRATRIETEQNEDISRPQLRYCPYCKCEVVTETQYKSGKKTW